MVCSEVHVGILVSLYCYNWDLHWIMVYGGFTGFFFFALSMSPYHYTHWPLYLVYLFIYLLTLISNEPITLPQVHAFRHVETAMTTIWSSNRATKGGEKKFKWLWMWHVLWHVRWAGLSVPETTDVLGNSHIWGLQRMVWKRQNIQWAPVFWVKLLCWCQGSKETASSWLERNSK